MRIFSSIIPPPQRYISFSLPRSAFISILFKPLRIHIPGIVRSDDAFTSEPKRGFPICTQIHRLRICRSRGRSGKPGPPQTTSPRSEIPCDPTLPNIPASSRLPSAAGETLIYFHGICFSRSSQDFYSLALLSHPFCPRWCYPKGPKDSAGNVPGGGGGGYTEGVQEPNVVPGVGT